MKLTEVFGTEAGNHTTYSNCHGFMGESKLSFADLPSGGAATALPLDKPLELQTGQPLTTVLAQDIDTAQAAAGDPVLLRTVWPIKTSIKKIFLPKNSTVKGRIVRLQFSYGAAPRMTLVIRLEEAEWNGRQIPLSALAMAIEQKRAPLTIVESGKVAVITRPNTAPGFVLKHGFTIRWMTTDAPNKPQTAQF